MVLEVAMVVIGVLAHYLNEIIKNGKDPRRYWLDYRINTFLSILGAIAASILLIHSGCVDLYTYLMAGYVSDSIFNKSPLSSVVDETKTFQK